MSYPLPQEDIRARALLRAWIEVERAFYADETIKYGEGTETRDALVEEMRHNGFGDRHVDLCLQYVKRAQVLGAHTPQGKQAMGKAIVSLMHLLETALVVWNDDMPEPGRPSGDIVDWMQR